MAVIQVLTDGGYEVEREDDQNLTTGISERNQRTLGWVIALALRHRQKSGRCVCHTHRRADTRLRLHVQYDGKDGIFTRWEDSSTPLPQSAENQLRLIKNALHIL